MNITQYIRQLQQMEDIDEQNQHNNNNQISNTSLVINHLQNAFQQNQNQIDLMEHFIKSKTNQIANLQAYLISEFQSIENSKARNKKIEKILVTSTIPMLQQISRSLQSFKKMLLPFSTVAFSFITALSAKSQQLLSQKQKIIDEQYEKIKQLKQIIDNSNKPKQIPHKKPIKEIVVVEKKEDTQKKAQKAHLSYNVTNFDKVVKQSPKRSNNTSKSKTPTKLNKYEQYYQAILDNKKQIKYHCQRVLSPHQTNIQPKKPEIIKQIAPKYQRKDYIKQKIEKIKIRTQCKQRSNKFQNT